MSLETIESAEQAFHRGELNRAARICSDILETVPDHAAATLLTALVAMRKGQVESAIDLLRRALELSPNDYVAMTWLIVAFRSASQFDEAVEVGKAARSLWPDDPEILVSLSLGYLGIRDVKSAIECLKKASILQPKNITIRGHLGIAYELMAMDSEAAQEFRAAIDIEPRNEKPYVQLGRLLMGHGNYVQVLELCESALKVIPRSAQIHLMYAQTLRDLREHDAAEDHLKKAMEYDPQISLSAAFWLHEDGQFERAAEYFRQSIQLRPVQGLAYFGLVQGKKVSESDWELLDTMKGLLDNRTLQPKERASLHYGLGKAFNELKEFEPAMKHFDAGNQLNYQIYLAGRGFDVEESRSYVRKVIDMFSSEFMERNGNIGSETRIPIFVVGMIRSGTTLLEQIISSHPDVGAAGEQKFWMAEIPRVINLDDQTLDLEGFSEIQQRYLKVLRAFQSDSKHITDKMPMNYYWAGLIHLAYPYSPIIHIRRNAVDNALSIYMTELAKPPEFAHVKENIVEAYREYLTMTDHWRAVIPAKNLLEVRYEDLVANQEKLTRQIIEFCDLRWDPACLEFFANKRPVSTPSMWQVRQPIYKTSVEKWRNYEPWLGAFGELIGLG